MRSLLRLPYTKSNAATTPNLSETSLGIEVRWGLRRAPTLRTNRLRHIRQRRAQPRIHLLVHNVRAFRHQPVAGRDLQSERDLSIAGMYNTKQTASTLHVPGQRDSPPAP